MIYPLRSAEQFEKMTGVLKEGLGRFSNDNNIAYTDAVLSEITDVSTRYRVAADSLGDERLEAQALFGNFVGDFKTKDTHPYEKLVSMIYDASKVYEGKGNLPIGDFEAYVNGVYFTSQSQYEYNEAVDHYIEDHPLILACNDPGFLFFANYMMNVQKKAVDEEFVRDVKDVISASMVLQDMEFVRADFNKKEYNKIAKFTTKTIKRFEAEKAKKAEQAQGIARKKTNNK